MLGSQMAMVDFLCWRHEGMAAGCGLWLAVRGRGRAVLEQQHWEEWHTCHVFVHFFFSPHRSCDQAEETDIFLIKTFHGGQYNGGGT